MNKQEYEKALQNYKKLYERYIVEYHVDKQEIESMYKGIKLLEELIEERFDNKPLEIYELKNYQNYWHVDYGWVRIKNIVSYDCIVISTLTNDGYIRIPFEEDMFYEREVE